MKARVQGTSLALALLAAGCGSSTLPDGGAALDRGVVDQSALGQMDQSTIDLATVDGAPGDLCTTMDCASAPCTAGCAFVVAQGPCANATPAKVSAATVAACPGFCGRFGAEGGVSDFGCLRYRVEEPKCTPWCWQWGNGSCFERAPSIDYSTGGAICDRAKGWNCYSPLPPADGGTTCVDAGHRD